MACELTTTVASKKASGKKFATTKLVNRARHSAFLADCGMAVVAVGGSDCCESCIPRKDTSGAQAPGIPQPGCPICHSGAVPKPHVVAARVAMIQWDVPCKLCCLKVMPGNNGMCRLHASTHALRLKQINRCAASLFWQNRLVSYATKKLLFFL